MSDALTLIRALRSESSPSTDAFELALCTVATMVNNVLEHPEEPKGLSAFRAHSLAARSFANEHAMSLRGALVSTLSDSQAAALRAALDGKRCDPVRSPERKRTEPPERTAIIDEAVRRARRRLGDG